MKVTIRTLNSEQTIEYILDANDYYTKKKGYGFITEQEQQHHPILQVPELSTGFLVWEWLKGQSVTTIKNSALGISTISDQMLPLSFRCDLPHQGNYMITCNIVTGEMEGSDLLIFAGCRRLMKRQVTLASDSRFSFLFAVNLCDIIPRGYETPAENASLSVSLLGKNIYLESILIEEISLPTLYIGGDSTVTDQSSCYPYDPANSYCGWGQMLPFYLHPHVAVSNHAHSGLTTESFTSEGHFSIVESVLQKEDYLFLQFGHNDQKLSHLKAEEGYRTNLARYIESCLKKGATPVLITPVCRNSWRGNDGSYHDLLASYASVCRTLALEYGIPCCDLHKRTYDFITSRGLEDSKRYFFPGDFTHTNDYGGYLFAGFLAEEMLLDPRLSPLVRDTFSSVEAFSPPEKIQKIHPPKGANYVPSISPSIPVRYTDLKQCKHQESIPLIRWLASQTILIQREEQFHPTDLINRIEALELVIKACNFFPTNVYNDMFVDVIGHEWYAGLVECSYSNGIIPNSMILDSKFLPLSNVTYSELLIFCINGYRSRFLLSSSGTDHTRAAKEIGIYTEDFDPAHTMTREETVQIIAKLYDKITNG